MTEAALGVTKIDPDARGRRGARACEPGRSPARSESSAAKGCRASRVAAGATTACSSTCSCPRRLSDEQRRLLEEFARERRRRDLRGATAGSSTASGRRSAEPRGSPSGRRSRCPRRRPPRSPGFRRRPPAPVGARCPTAQAEEARASLAVLFPPAGRSGSTKGSSSSRSTAAWTRRSCCSERSGPSSCVSGRARLERPVARASTGPWSWARSGSAHPGSRRRAGAIPVVVDPGQAFGTGAHPTTRLCLELLLEQPASAVLDLGCGSGVLAIAAAKLGMGPVVAVDHDAAAVEAARANARRNGVELDVRQGDVRSEELPGADLGLANLELSSIPFVAARFSGQRLDRLRISRRRSGGRAGLDKDLGARA